MLLHAFCFRRNGTRIEATFIPAPLESKGVTLGEYEHFMHKEMHEQSEVVRTILCQYVHGLELAQAVDVTGLNLGKVAHVHIVGCGSAFHAGFLGKKYLELVTRLPITVEMASESRYSGQGLSPKTLVIAISQSGETADTLACVQKARVAGCQIVAVCNHGHSALVRLASKTILLHCGPEISVTATKSFTAMVLCLYLFSLACGRNRGLISKDALKQKLAELADLPGKVSQVLDDEELFRAAAAKYASVSSVLFIGRNWHHPIAMEGALKLKEISYIHAEGMAGGDLKHGTLALVNKATPVIALAPKDAQYSKIMSNVREIRARGGRIIGLGSEGDCELREECQDFFQLPSVPETLMPILSSIALQFWAYHTAKVLGTDIDRPRHLAKSLTVE